MWLWISTVIQMVVINCGTEVCFKGHYSQIHYLYTEFGYSKFNNGDTFVY